MTTYDNNNRGSLFTPKSESAPCDLSGKAEIGGRVFYIDCYRCSGRVSAVAVFKEADNHDNLIVVPLRASDKGKCIMYGKFTLAGVDYSVNVFKSEKKNERSPVLQLSFMVKEAAVEAQTPKLNTPPSDYPF